MGFGRELCQCSHDLRGTNECRKCGANKGQNAPLKTVGFGSPVHMPMRLYKKHLKRRQAGIVSDSKEISEATYNLLSSICDKFLYSRETLALGLYIFQSLREMSPHEKFWASSCLMVASKAIELDKNVPYLNRFQRYADKDHTQQEYEAAERTIFEAMQFDLQYSTFVSFLNFYLTCGVVFEADELNRSLVQYFEDDVLLKSKELLRKGNFCKWDQEKLALYVIKDTRKKYNLSEWNSDLEKLTGFPSSAICAPEEGTALQVRRTELTENIDSGSAPLVISKPHKVADLKNICMRKRLDEICSSKATRRSSRANSISVKENSLGAYHTTDISSSIKPKSNIVLAPINSHFLTNNSVFNLATKRR